MKSCCLSLLLIAPLTLDAQTKGALTPDVIYAQSKNSVVTILTFDSQKAPLAQGSGFVVAKNRVATNYHVLAGSTSASIVFNDGSMVVVNSVVGASLPKDLAIINSETGNRPALLFGDELGLKVGETVYAIGAPSGLSASLSDGLVSGFREDEGQFLIQTTAAIAPGSSGGPLINSHGQVIGITTSRLKDGGFGFAVGAGDLQHLLKAPLPIAMALSDLPGGEAAAPTDELKPTQAFLDQKKYPEALASFQKASAQAQSGYEGQLLLCQIQEKNTEYNSAIQACEAAIKLRPDSAEAYGDKAVPLLASGDLESAEAAAATATKLSNEAYYAHLLGLVYYSEEKYALVPKQISAESKDTFELTLLAGASLRNGDSESFKDLCAKITAIKGANNGWQLYLDGVTALRDLNYDTAIEKFRKCDADDDFIDPVCIASEASAEITKGDSDSAKSHIDSAVTRYPRNHSVLSEAIFIDLVTGNTADAKKLHQVLQSMPRYTIDDSTDCLFFYGINQAATATAHCAAALKGNEDKHVAWSNAGYVALDNGQFDTAFSYFTKAKELFYSSKDKHTGIEELDLAWGMTLGAYFSGDKKDAKFLYHAIKTQYPDYTKMTALKQLPLVWSDATQELVSKVIAEFK
jgi:tetratricopeptide (TPR) repeat protein